MTDFEERLLQVLAALAESQRELCESVAKLAEIAKELDGGSD